MKYCKEIVIEICGYLEKGSNQEDAAELAGIGKSTFYEWMQKSDFADAIKKAEKKCKHRNEALIQRAAINTWQAAAWWLERRYGETYALRLKNEHSGPGGGPIQTQSKPLDFTGWSKEELLRAASLKDGE